ncbi:MAG: Crp/Fnr family transcriptional regulator [Bacillota bacterium]|nr:Crp/Fnr family transcriptional regulator [Bacillota bacterium]
MERKREYLERLPFWKELSDSEKELVFKHSGFQKYEKGRIIHSCDSNCLGMVTVVKGTIRTYIMSEEGREITLFKLYGGDTCVLAASCVIRQITFDTFMVAEDDCEVLVIHASAFLRLTQNNIHVRCYMFELSTEKFSAVMWSMQQILFKKFDRRLASFLIGEYERTGSPVINMTHEQIAQHTSSAREVVARMLKRFASDGLVEFRRGTIRLTDIEGLKKIS